MNSSEKDAWTRLSTELDLWLAQERLPTLWWRDDDAFSSSEPLSLLCALTQTHPIGLAVIPTNADPELVQTLKPFPYVRILQHGVTHDNYALTDQPKNEFPTSRPLKQIKDSLRRGLQKLLSLFPQALSALVPPWNRLRSDLIPRLSKLGYSGLSRFSARSADHSSSLIQVNTHVDVIEWKSKTFIGVDPALTALTSHLRARRHRRVDPKEPTGILTHHLVHDPQTWDFLHQLSTVTDSRVIWEDPLSLFSCRAIPSDPS